MISSRLRLAWSKLLGTLWFIPAILVVANATLAVILVEISPRIDQEVLGRFPRLFGASPESARGMLVAIAGSMITVAGVTFSITIVAVTQASAQFTPRILRNFMRDRPSQVALGGLTGVFTYCLVVLRTIRGTEAYSFVPSVAVLVGFVLAGVGIVLLIWFIHHIAESLQASSIIMRVARDTEAAIDRLFPEEVGDPASQKAHPEEPGADAWKPVRAQRTGYIQWVDGERMLKLAKERDTVIRMEKGVGDFVVETAPIASIAQTAGKNGLPGAAQLENEFDGLFTLGSFRTVEQDAAFGIRQIADIALKALSPGINDPTTAINCIDYMASVLARAAAREPEPLWRADDDGKLRVIGRTPTFEALIDQGLGEIRRYAGSHLAVMERLVDGAGVAGGAARTMNRREVILVELESIIDTARRDLKDEKDLARLIKRAREAQEAIRKLPI